MLVIQVWNVVLALVLEVMVMVVVGTSVVRVAIEGNVYGRSSRSFMAVVTNAAYEATKAKQTSALNDKSVVAAAIVAFMGATQVIVV